MFFLSIAILYQHPAYTDPVNSKMTLAITVDRELGSLQIGAAFQSPEDVDNSVRAQNIAAARLNMEKGWEIFLSEEDASTLSLMEDESEEEQLYFLEDIIFDCLTELDKFGAPMKGCKKDNFWPSRWSDINLIQAIPIQQPKASVQQSKASVPYSKRSSDNLTSKDVPQKLVLVELVPD